MMDLQCNVHTAICVQHLVGAAAAQAGSSKETTILKNTNSISKHKASMSYTDIEGAFVDIDKSSKTGYRYNDIEVLTFDNDVSSISYCVDIEVSGLDVKDSSISYCVDIEGYNLQY
jgi:hypothetical protein